MKTKIIKILTTASVTDAVVSVKLKAPYISNTILFNITRAERVLQLDNYELPTKVIADISRVDLEEYSGAAEINIVDYLWIPQRTLYGNNKEFVHGRITINTSSYSLPSTGVKLYSITSIPSSSVGLTSGGSLYIDPPTAGSYLNGELHIRYLLLDTSGNPLLEEDESINQIFNINYFKA